MPDDIWIVWPDGVMCAECERRDLEDLLSWKSDDFERVQVTAYDETSSPCEWYRVGGEAEVRA